jgi:hypothetical protein
VPHFFIRSSFEDASVDFGVPAGGAVSDGEEDAGGGGGGGGGAAAAGVESGTGISSRALGVVEKRRMGERLKERLALALPVCRTHLRQTLNCRSDGFSDAMAGDGVGIEMFECFAKFE